MQCPYCQKEIEVEPVIIASGEDFEKYLCDQINSLSSAKCETTKKTGDQGADLIVILEGGEKVAVQCKLYSTPVGNDAVQQVVAGRLFYKCDKAMVVTNSTYTQSAFELAEATSVELVNYRDFKKRIDEMSGGYRKRILSALESCAGERKPLESYSHELRFVAEVLLGGGMDWDKIQALHKEYFRIKRALMPVTASIFANYVAQMIPDFIRRAEDGEFGDGLKDGISRRYEAKAALEFSDDVKDSVGCFSAYIQILTSNYAMAINAEEYDGKMSCDLLPDILRELFKKGENLERQQKLAKAAICAGIHYLKFLFGDNLKIDEDSAVADADPRTIRSVIATADPDGYGGFDCVHCGMPLSPMSNNCFKCGTPTEDSIWQLFLGER